jgi:hypothetical protein
MDNRTTASCAVVNADSALRQRSGGAPYSSVGVGLGLGVSV